MAMMTTMMMIMMMVWDGDGGADDDDDDDDDDCEAREPKLKVGLFAAPFPEDYPMNPVAYVASHWV